MLDIRTEVELEEEEWGQDAGAITKPPPATEDLGPAAVEHVVGDYHRYPGEIATFYTLVTAYEPLSDLTLRITIPKSLELGDYHPPANWTGLMPYVEEDENARYLVWLLQDDLPAGTQYEFVAEARVLPTYWNSDVRSRAVLTTADHQILGEEIVTFKTWAKGKYLRFLPELYESDELMGRFLMLFESFWSPIETQIDNVHNYFDPRITPFDFLPWLASWLDLDLDESWPEDRLRHLIRWAIALHRSRGTKWGLLKYLEIYTGRQAKVIEQRSKNFVLGPEAKLGPGVALGTGNVPHTFSVYLRLPKLEADDEETRNRMEKLRRDNIEKIINLQKPAHTVYSLELEIVDPGELEIKPVEEAVVQAVPSQEDDEITSQTAIWFKLDEE